MKAKIIGFIAFFLLASLQLAANAQGQSTSPASDKVFFDFFPNDPSGSKTLDGGIVNVQHSSKLSIASAEKLFAQVYNVAKIVNNGRDTNRVAIVFLGDGYTASQLPSYQQTVSNLTGELFTRRAPYIQYAPYFNVYRVDVASTDSGVDNDPTRGITKNTALDAGYWCAGTARLICVDTTKVNAAAAAAPRADQKLVLINSSTWGGAGYPGLGIATIVAGYGYYTTEIIIHEMGHSLGLLADEYDYGGGTTYTAAEPSTPNVSKLTASTMKAAGTKWSGWLGYNNASFGGLTSTFEGASYYIKGIFRPTYDSAMRNVDRNFNMPSLESLITEIYKKVRPIDAYTINNVMLRQTDTINITVLRPTDHALNISWYVDGIIVPAAAEKSTFNLASQTLSAGLHKVSVSVVDNTPWVRNSQLRKTYLTQLKDWLVLAGDPAQAPVITQQPANTTVMEGTTATFTIKVANTTGVKYQWLKDGQMITGATSATYSFTTVRANAGAYSCVVSNTKGGIKSANATLSITLPTAPVITKQPTLVSTLLSPTQIVEGIPAILSVTATSTGPLSYQWRANQVNITGATSASYTFTPTNTMNGTWYDCVVSNGSGRVTSSNIRLTVIPRSTMLPTLYRQTLSVSVAAGQTAGFVAQATSPYGTTLRYQWYRNNVAIPGATSFTYMVTATKLLTGSVYSCVVSNEYGAIRTNNATLTVN